MERRGGKVKKWSGGEVKGKGMKSKNNRFFLVAMAALSVLPAAALTKPSVPQAPVITYGLIRDEFGSPLTGASKASLALVRSADRDGTVYATSSVGDSGIAGMNYRLSLEIDSSGPRRTRAVLTGTEMYVKAWKGSSEITLSPTATFATPAQGTRQRLDFSTGKDEDADGMPDDWEEWMLYLAGEDYSFAGIVAFRPGDDADRDGMTNLQEYLAGTDPFIATDLLKVESFERVPGTERARLTFLTAVGRKYRVLMSESLSQPNWTPVATAQAPDDELVYENYPGDGYRMTLYVDARLASVFFRVAAN